jgi:hypothetical protein
MTTLPQEDRVLEIGRLYADQDLKERLPAPSEPGGSGPAHVGVPGQWRGRSAASVWSSAFLVGRRLLRPVFVGIWIAVLALVWHLIGIRLHEILLRSSGWKVWSDYPQMGGPTLRPWGRLPAPRSWVPSPRIQTQSSPLHLGRGVRVDPETLEIQRTPR